MSISEPRAWAEIDLAAWRYNLETARRMSGGCEIMAVVKAGAYGHGLEEMTRRVAGNGIAFFGVANVGEARRIRSAGVDTRIYLLGATWHGEREEIVARDWTPCISTFAEAEHFNHLAQEAGKTLKVHISVDTGMGRGGFLEEETDGLREGLARFRNLEIEGIGSHLPSADEDGDFTRKQIAHFDRAVDALGGEGVLRYRHLLNSAGLIGYQCGRANLVRPGLMLYGVCPMGGASGVQTVMSLKSRVTLVRVLPTGHGVSYGRQFVTTRPTRVATIGVGYGDGYPRHLSGNGAEVFLRGRRFPLLGRVTMDQIMVDVTGADEVAEGDEVELFGTHIPAAEVAQKAGTIPWEIFTGITPRVERRYRG